MIAYMWSNENGHTRSPDNGDHARKSETYYRAGAQTGDVFVS